MSKPKGLINRMTIAGVAVLIQLAWIGVMVFRLSEYYFLASVLLSILSFVAAIHIINGRSNPAVKLAWLVPIIAFPIFGGLIYLLFGTKVPLKKISSKINNEEAKNRCYIPQCKIILGEIEKEDKHIAGQLRYIDNMGFPVYKDTATEYFSIGKDYFEALVNDLKTAKKFIFMEYFIVDDGYMWDTILEVLKEKAKNGVDVRVMYDDVGCLNTLPVDYCNMLKSFGIKCHAFNQFIPVISIAANNRDHRKIAVVDGNVAYTGGINLADEYINRIERFGHWKDTGVRIAGKGVWNFTLMFLNMWNSFEKNDDDIIKFLPSKAEVSDGYVAPFGDSPLDHEIFSENVYINIINYAVDYVYICTPYLVVDNQTMTALCLAAKRGVDVRIITPGIPDKKTVFALTRSHYPELIENGVRIYEYTPGFIHAKSFVCDDKAAIVGTINMDYRSLYHHFECGCYFYKSSVIGDIKKDFLDTVDKSELVEDIESKYKVRGLVKSFWYALLRLFAPLM